MSDSVLRTLLRTWGPAWLVMIADVDAASVITAAENGALYGTGLVWLLVVLIVPLYVIQEVAGRLGTVTGKGLGQLTRENFRPRTAALAALPMAGADVMCYVVEYTGMAIGLQIFGIPSFASVPLVFVLQLVLAYRRRYDQVEKALLVVSIALALAYAISAYLRVSKGVTFTSTLSFSAASPTFFFLIAANIGSTIMPFMLFYQASASANKGITATNLWAMRVETAVGAVVSESILIAIEVATTGVAAGSVGFASPTTLSSALSNVIGPFAQYFFGIGLVSAGFIALIVTSMGSAWGVVDAMGWSGGKTKSRWFTVYVLESVPALFITLAPYNLVNLALGLLALQVVVLIGPAITLGLLTSRASLMGTHSLRSTNKFLYWFVLFLVVSAGVVSLVF